ncbi:Drug/metabolite transporter [Corchorus olitorius]|uniref:Drug/metabolite transporter n=2 Tax=Magnoliopsida TaxID=3398 RepID=A0A1R3IIG1_9ROSI|nr:Drug/metabolite transporter [Corchorus olitorius]
MMKCCKQWKPVAAMLAVNFALAIANVLLKKILDEGVSHIIILLYRQSISAVFLAPIAYFLERATLTQYFFLLGLEYTSATFSCAFINMVPAITFMLALPFGLEKLDIRNKAGRAKVLGTLICLGGAMILTLYKGKTLVKSNSQTTAHLMNYADVIVSSKKKEKWAIGSIFLAAGCIFWSSWFLLQANIGKTYPCQYSSTAFLSFFSAIQTAILGLITERDFSKWVLKGKLELITVTYAGMVGSSMCYVGMSWCVKQKGPVFTSAFTPLVQVFVAMFDVSILHGQIYVGSVIGSILVVIGLYILLWGRNSEPLPRQIPRTIENTREADETVCMPDDEELFAGNDVDEFSSIIKRDRTPKILITTSRFNSTRGPAFISELLSVIPNAQYYKRGTYDLKKVLLMIVEYANNKDFTSIIVVHTNRREPDALLMVCLPDGPTAHFKLSSLVLRKDIKNHGNPTSHEPELVLNNFTTRLGHRIGRFFQSIFPQEPNFRGRRVVTFHNQRDFIFFRHHRYIFDAKEIKQSEAKGKKLKDAKGESIAKEKVVARLQECGPRFTLKLISLQHGTFDTKGGEYEWVHKPEMDTSRRRFFL